MKVVGSRSQLHEQKNVHCLSATPMLQSEHDYNCPDSVRNRALHRRGAVCKRDDGKFHASCNPK